jgi:FkbM family methyltransferase
LGEQRLKFVKGIALPDSDTHFETHNASSPMVAGKGTYQLKKLNAALPHVCEFRHAIDIGGHVGTWARVLSQSFDKVSVFEPMADLYACASVNLKDCSNVELRGFALGPDDGNIMMSSGITNSGNACINDKGSIKVPSRRLDSFNFTQVDFIKIDTEGFEYFILQGGEQTIKRWKPAMVVEQKPQNASRYGLGDTDAVQLLESWGAQLKSEISGDFILAWS